MRFLSLFWKWDRGFWVIHILLKMLALNYLKKNNPNSLVYLRTPLKTFLVVKIVERLLLLLTFGASSIFSFVRTKHLFWAYPTSQPGFEHNEKQTRRVRRGNGSSQCSAVQCSWLQFKPPDALCRKETAQGGWGVKWVGNEETARPAEHESCECVQGRTEVLWGAALFLVTLVKLWCFVVMK